MDLSSTVFRASAPVDRAPAGISIPGSMNEP